MDETEDDSSAVDSDGETYVGSDGEANFRSDGDAAVNTHRNSDGDAEDDAGNNAVGDSDAMFMRPKWPEETASRTDLAEMSLVLLKCIGAD